MNTETKRVYTMAEVAKILGVSLNFCYMMARAGKIPSLKIGRRVMVPSAMLEKMLNLEGKLD